jgi:D-3-phosphoglycerate dehydrogenase / 2-oxoglutarate reductase
LARTKIVFTDYYYPHIEQERAILSKLPDVELVDCTSLVPGGVKREDQVLEHCSDADALIVQFAQVTRRVIEGLKRCKVVARYAIGVDTIDVKAAHEHGIAVANVPDYCIEEVSDTAVAHILNCVRKVTAAHALLHSGAWSYEKIKPIRRFNSLTVGLVAFGHIARRVAEKLQSFGCSILAHDPHFVDTSRYPWVTFLPLDELMARSDVLSIHAPQSKETHHLINRERLGLMRRGSIIVNTSRGALVDEAALAEALDDGRVAAAGLDVLDSPDADFAKSLLMRYPDRVFITPHMGWYSEEAIQELQRKTALNVFETLTNGKPLHQV